MQLVLEPLELRVFQNAQNSLCSGNPKWLLNLLVSSCSSCFMASLGDGHLKGVSESLWNFWSLLSGFFGIPTSAHDTTVDIDWHARFDFDINWLTLCIFISSNLHIFFTYFSHLPIFNQLPSSSQRCIGIVVCYSWHHLAFIPSSIHLRNGLWRQHIYCNRVQWVNRVTVPRHHLSVVCTTSKRFKTKGKFWAIGVAATMGITKTTVVVWKP